MRPVPRYFFAPVVVVSVFPASVFAGAAAGAGLLSEDLDSGLGSDRPLCEGATFGPSTFGTSIGIARGLISGACTGGGGGAAGLGSW